MIAAFLLGAFFPSLALVLDRLQKRPRGPRWGYGWRSPGSDERWVAR